MVDLDLVLLSSPLTSATRDDLKAEVMTMEVDAALAPPSATFGFDAASKPACGTCLYMKKILSQLKTLSSDVDVDKHE